MILPMFIVMLLSTCYATDTNFDEEKNARQMSGNAWKEVQNENYRIFLENAEISFSPPNRVKLYKGDHEMSVEVAFSETQNVTNKEKMKKIVPENQTENQLALYSSYPKVVVEKRKCLACLENSALRLRARIANTWQNLEERTQTKILATVCCPCVFMRYWPDFLTFILWIIFFFESKRVCVSNGKSISCENNQTARDITGVLTILFLLIRIFKYCKKKYRIRPRRQDPRPLTLNYGINF